MGSNQSRIGPSVGTTEREKAVFERLRALQFEAREGLEDDYVHINHEKANQGVQSMLQSRQPETVPVSRAAEWQDALLKDPKNRLAINALSSASPKTVLATPAVKIADQHVFNVKIPFEGGPITNQRQSGRCWLFASTNIFRIALMQKYGLESFELSQAYLFFWDKLEKSNWFLEQIISTADMDLDSRLVQTLLQEPLSDGGQWDMVYNLVAKYGLVPQALYPDSFSASASSTLNSILFTKLREYALILRNLLSSSSPSSSTVSSLSETKAKMLREIHTILTLTLGPPPSVDEPFAWSFTDKLGRARTVHATPLAFAADIYSPRFRITSAAVAGLVSLVHDPRHEPLSLLQVDRLGNVVGGRGTRYVNVGMAALKRACVAMLRRGLPVFFGCDVGQSSDSRAGVMDLRLIDWEAGFNVSLLSHGGGVLDKAARLRTGESLMTHAMVLTGVHVDDATGQTVRWRVQNSWGEGVGKDGWFVMQDEWMDEFVYQAVVDPSVLTDEERAVLSKEPIVLPRWDPMGSLA
ncbi:peptidase C1B, bleomycin hydrolase [Corynascus similis CBS 632.67]